MPPLNGMIYDKDNRPVTDTTINVDGIFKASSDVYGRFSLPGLKKYESHSVQITKKGFEPADIDLVYTDPTQVIYIQMYSAPQLIAEAETAIQAQDWQNAESLLQRSEKSGGDPAAIGYLKAVLAFKKELYTEAVSILNKLLSEGKTQAYICLFLADIYEYKLNDTNAAQENLRKFLESRYDPDVELRLDKLKDAVKL